MKNYFTSEDEKLKWKTLAEKSLLKTIVFDVTAYTNQSASGVRGDYFVMKAPDWVIVIAKKEDKFIMVKQWRHGEKALSVEFPGGVIDKGEEPEKAAKRELLEETGCIAGKLTKLGSVNPNPALFNNHVHVFLAEDLTATGKQELDADEFINCMELSEDEIMEGMGTPQFPHGLMTMAMCLYLKHKKNVK
ncbi:NUDIX hydrolase [Treponema sp. C6A8]|uniref:NUDIX hydrolase n=1 Tax=Treponema sp. C6A8 TaxID=1410609 RepID=UPI000482D4D3|nr:NUDIX hydrolase [Treponema sp. C6A8]